ncbi:hypothetical protein QJS10_CPA16g01438 [Acorus calamus]|uniref:Uncharacterized protein n=1 Tax=Acorus calamus TaxID=4465 RepID=A0AAV9D0M1_ACOCL|nr:hypothetical protein QJS10_CPA16g01438 [Acorus calamus]
MRSRGSPKPRKASRVSRAQTAWSYRGVEAGGRRPMEGIGFSGRYGGGWGRWWVVNCWGCCAYCRRRMRRGRGRKRSGGAWDSCRRKRWWEEPRRSSVGEEEMSYYRSYEMEK